jgi:hypothetical protein
MNFDQKWVSAWMNAMRQGDFARAWEISDQLLAQRVGLEPPRHLPRHQQWIWDGRPLAGRKVFVRCYHGLGDTIQLARFLPRLVELAREVTVWVQPQLVPLLQRLPRPVGLLPLHEGQPAGLDCEVDLELMELPHALRVTLATLSAEVPYLAVPAAPRLSDRFSVGLVAQAGDWDPRRSVPVELIASLGEQPGIALFNLLPGSCLPGAIDASDPDVLVAAARVQALDLVISVDTMMAHLAGALGVPTWTLLHAEADWRWMEDRDDSPWYPTMRLFRQERPGDWGDVLLKVQAALVEWLATRSSRVRQA